MGLLERLNFTLPTVNVMGTVPSSVVASFDKVVGSPTCVGPPGPFPTVSRGRTVYYGGALTNGNYFGACEVTIAGAFQEDVVYEVPPPPAPSYNPAQYPLAAVFHDLAEVFRGPRYEHEWLDGTFIATGTLIVNPPQPAVFTPNPVTIPKGSPGPHADVRVQVTPAGPYDIVLSIKDLEARSSLFVPTIVRTENDGTGTFFIQDLANAVRNNMVVTATISSQIPCSAPDVVSTFTVNVV
jgi:hypothetical protein